MYSDIIYDVAAAVGLDNCVQGNNHHCFIVCERDGDVARKLMCQYCLQIISYKTVKKLNNMKTVSGDIVDMQP